MKNNTKIITIENQLKNISERLSKISIKKENAKERYLDNNIFYILGIQDFEIRHSNFLAWLFRNEISFLKRFLTDPNICGLSYSQVSRMSFEKEDYLVTREYNLDTNGRSIDIVLNFKKDKVVVVIENKWNSEESKMQLLDYYNSIENTKEFVGYQKIYIFLTKKGVLPKSEIDKKNYIDVSYEKILDILLHINITEKLNEKNFLINNYIEILKEKTEKTMYRVSEYFKLYKENKEVVSEMLEYLPNIKQRAEIEKEYLTTNKTLTLQTKNANTFLDVLIDELTDVFRAKNLPDNFVYMQLCNDPYSKFNIVFCMLKIDNLHKKFMKDFSEKFAIKEKTERNGSYRTIYSTTIVSNIKQDGYITEEQFQEKITIGLKDFFEDKNSEYFKIVDFIKHYQFN